MKPDILTIVIDQNTERRVHLSLILDSLDVNYLRVRDSIELAQVVEEIGRPIVLILGMNKDHDQLENLINYPSKERLRIYTILVGSSIEALPESISSGLSLAIQGQGTKQEIASAMELAEQQLPRAISSDKSPDYSWKIAGECAQIKTVKQQIELVASTDVSVMLGGDSGTGKELAAQAIHELSHRSNGPFVAVNCGAIPKELIESELFGHEKGSFSGASCRRTGKFEQAIGGTLFLDEVGDMPLDMQVKLLRVLQERCIERVGGNTSIAVDVRIVAATHRNLVQCTAEGTFREDLYYRLNVFPIDMPALNERRDDIPLICRTLIKQLASSHNEPIRLSRAAQDTLCGHKWPGNIRELRNLIERLHVLYPGKEVDRADLPPEYRLRKPVVAAKSIPPLELPPVLEPERVQPEIPTQSRAQQAKSDLSVQMYQPRGPGICILDDREQLEELLDGFGDVTIPVDLKQRVREIERVYLEQALSQSDGIVSKAAGLLGMQRTTLVEKMKKLEVERPVSSDF